MCGIVALFRLPGVDVPEGTLRAMTDAVAHRGPDGWGLEHLPLEREGSWRAGLGHRRLSILDLSDAGKQPMVYKNRYWITYNGEVYNFVELRRELEQLGHVFRSHCDTEVILAAYDQWGADCFERMRGMWGLVLVDLDRRTAILCRDRMGIKPLYVLRRGGMFAVASEIKQFLDLPHGRLSADASAVHRYLITGYEDAGTTFFSEVLPVAAGHYQRLNLDTLELGPPEPYWWPERVEQTVTDYREASDLFREMLRDAVRLHMRSDVPVGCALSGGLDSSAVAGCVTAMENGEGPKGALNTFSVVFPNEPMDERKYIDQVLDFMRVEPHFVEPTSARFLEDLDDFVWKHDEPVGSFSQYAGYCVARLTREAGVPVTLNGQGGDEVLSGYWQCYFVYLQRIARELRAPRLTKHFGGALLPGGNPELVRMVPRMFKRYLDRRRAPQETRGPLDSALTMSAHDWRVYEIRELILPRLLKWDDRNFMAFSVEGRYPFLDHMLIELCLSFSPGVLYDRGWTKEPLRRGLNGLVPQSILRRKSKIGFETPQGRWLTGPLAPLVESIVSGDSPAWQFADPAETRQLARRVRETGAASPEGNQALLRFILLDRWMRRFQLN